MIDDTTIYLLLTALVLVIVCYILVRSRLL